MFLLNSFEFYSVKIELWIELSSIYMVPNIWQYAEHTGKESSVGTIFASFMIYSHHLYSRTSTNHTHIPFSSLKFYQLN